MEKNAEDGHRQRLRIPKINLTTPHAGDAGAVAEAARLLVAAESLVILGGEAVRTENGLKLLIELAETLQAPVQGGRMPTMHPLSAGAPAVIAAASKKSRRATKPSFLAPMIPIGLLHLARPIATFRQHFAAIFSRLRLNRRQPPHGL